MQNKHWIVEGWNNMWKENGGPICGVTIISFIFLGFIKPLWFALLILAFFTSVVIAGVYMLFINPFVKAFKNRNM